MGVNGEQCQEVAKKLLSAYRDWYIKTGHRPLFTPKTNFERNMHQIFNFCPNAKKFSILCDTVIAYNDAEGRSEEFKHAFLDRESPLFQCINKGIESDPDNLVPILPFTETTCHNIGMLLVCIGGYLFGMGIARWCF